MKEELITKTDERYLLSKEAISAPPKERLALLLNARRYPMVSKRTSVERQIEEMKDLLDLFSFWLTKFIPDECAEYNCMMLSLMQADETTSSTATGQLAEAFKMLKDYEELERKIDAIKNLLFEYSDRFPDMYYDTELEELATKSLPDMVDEARYKLQNHPSWEQELKKRWGIE